MTPQDQIPSFNEWLKTRKATTSAVPTFEEFKAGRSTRPRNRAQVEAEIEQARTRMEQAGQAYVSAGGKLLNPPVTGKTDYFRPLTPTEKVAQKRGEPVIISEAAPSAQQIPVSAPQSLSRPRKTGTLEQGNIDLTKRPRVRNPDGSISTVRSISVNIDGREVLLPTVSDDGRILTEKQAIDQYRKTGKHLGVFDNPTSATTYAQKLHEDQARTLKAPVSLAPVIQGRIEQIKREKRLRETQQKVEQARQVVQRQGPQLTTNDAAWHFGISAQEAKRLRPHQLRILADAVREDRRKRAAGQQIAPPPRSYKNAMRAKAGLKPLPAQTVNLIDKGIPDLTNIATIEPLTFAEDVAQRAATKKEMTRLRGRAGAASDFAGEEYQNFLRLNRSLDSPQMREGFLTLKAKEKVEQYGSPTAALLAEDEETARRERVAKMGTGEYLAQVPKSAVGGLASGAGMTLKGLAIASKKIADKVMDTGSLEAKDTYTYRLGEYITQLGKDNPIYKSNPDLEKEFFVGKAPDTVGQSVMFLLGSWASQSPKVAVTILGAGMTAGDAYDEVKAHGGTDDQAVNAGLIAGGLLGPTELFGMRGAMRAIEGTVAETTLKAALKTALREGSRDVVENALQEFGQELGQGLITGNPRTLPELVEAGLLGAVGGLQTVPTSLGASAIETARGRPDVIDNYIKESPLSTPEEKAAIEQASIPDQKLEARAEKPSISERVVEKPQQIAPDQIAQERTSEVPTTKPAVETPAELKTQPPATESQLTTPKEVTDEVAAEAVSRAVPAAGKSIWEMSPTELRTAGEQEERAEREMLTATLGEKDGKRFEELNRRRFKVSATQAKQMEAEIEGILARATPEVRQRIDDWYLASEQRPSPNEYRTHLRDLEQIAGASNSEESMAPLLARILPRLGRETDPQRMTPFQQSAYAQLKYAAKVAREADLDPKRLEQLTQRAAGKLYGPNAESMLRELLEVKEKPTLDKIKQKERIALRSTDVKRQLSDWGGRLKSIAQSKDLNALQSLSDEMAAHKDDPRVARLRASIQEHLDRAKESDTPLQAKGEEAPVEYSEAIQQAFKDWANRRAYIDNNGNYHVKAEGQSSGPIALWNKEVKRTFKTVSEFHKAAQPKPESGQSSMFAKGEGEGLSFGIESNRVSLGREGAQLLSDAYRESGHLGKSERNIRGTYEKNPERLAKTLDQMAEKGSAGAADLADAVRRAAKTGQGKIVLFASEGARKHELFHETSSKSNRYLQDRHSNLDSLTENDTFSKMYRRLTAMGYDKYNMPALVEEAAAHIAEGRYDQLGITRDEAVEWMYRWFKSFEAKNPNVNPREFQELADEAEKARQRVYEATGRQPRPYETVPSVQEGREGGARESVAAARGDITDSEAFRKWFGDSKVVDENGEPLVVYHGTDADFAAFDKRKIGSNYKQDRKGFFFASKPSEAAGANYETEENRIVMPVYLSTQNPVVVEVRGVSSEYFDNHRAELLARVKDEHADGIIIRSSGGYGDFFAVFDPTQIKSATGNRGTFDPNDPNILMARSEDDYQGEHAPADAEGGAPLHNLNANEIYPRDVYSFEGQRYYSTGYDALDAETHSLVRSYRDHPGRPITIYRAVPRAAKAGITRGDWVTPIRRYAVEHGKDNLGGNYKIQTKRVFARDIFTDGNSWLEWGYDPQPFDAQVEREARERRRKRVSGEEPQFARSEDPWADLADLADEFEREIAEKPASTETKKPATEPEIKPSKLAAGVEAKAIEAKLTAGFQGLPEYETVKVADQARMAADLLRNDPQEARRVALGQSVPSDSKLLPESVFVAVENDALQRGDVETLRELATVSTLSAEATGMGQRIRMLGERNPYSPVTAMKEIQTAREARAKKKMGPKFKERVITEIKTEVRKAAPKAKDWKSFLEEIRCK